MTPTYQSGFAAPQRGRMKWPELWRGCVGAWNPGLGQSGLVLRDHSGYGNHGVLTNGPTWGVSGGRQALSFDGTDDNVTMGNTNFNIGTGSMTVSVWVMPTNAAGWYQGIFSNLDVNYANGAHIIYVDAGTNKLYTYFGVEIKSASAYFTNNQWVHVTLVRNANTLIFYKNGVQTDSNTVGVINFNSATDPTNIGSRSGGGSQFFAGFIDDVRIYRRALSSSEIRLLATRPGIAYELAPRRRSSILVPALSHIQYFSGSAARNGSIITGASPLGIVSKIQKNGSLITIPEDRFDDPRYYRS